MEELIGARTTNIWQTDDGDEGAPPTKLHCATRSHPGTHPVHKMCSSPLTSTFNLLLQIKSDIVRMPQALQTLYPLSHHPLFGLEEFPFPIIGLWGNKNWPPSMKVKKMENFQNKRGLKGCKWSCLNTPGTENLLYHSLFGVGRIPFSHY